MVEMVAARAPVLREHSQRRRLAGEVHARPYELLAAPVRISHLAVLHDGGDAGCKGAFDGGAERAFDGGAERAFDGGAERAFLAELLLPHGGEPPGEGATFFSRDLGALRLRWERHSEFSTYTFLRFDPFDQPFAATALDLVPRDWLDRLPGATITALHVAVETADRTPEDLAAQFDGNTLIGSRMMGGAAEAWTDLRLHADGFGRALVRDHHLTRGQTGRLAQRLLEIETYRMMALLAFPIARHANAETTRMDRGLAGIVAELADAKAGRNDRALLDHLTALAAEAEALDAATSFRLSAARAYHAIVGQRIAELREDRIPGLQTLGEFMDRRLAPAMKTCESAADRQLLLARRVSRAGDLLRTRVDIALEEKNRDLLRSMDRRAKVQLRLQETVEGLSVVAISYYLLGLVGYAGKGLKAAGLPVNSDVLALAALPVILGTVWLGVRRLRRAIGHGDGHGE